MRKRSAILSGVVLVAVLLLSGSRIVAEPAAAAGTPVACGFDSFVFQQNLVLVSRIGGFHKATDEGWKQLSTPRGSPVKATPDGTIYVLGGDDLYRSKDGGETWDLVCEHIPTGVGISWIFPSPMPDTVFVSVVDSPPAGDYGGIYRSTDGGATWRRVLGGADGTWVAFSPAFADDGTAFASLGVYHASVGVWKTEDWGETWVRLDGLQGGAFINPQTIFVSPQYPQDQTAFTSEDFGLYKTIDGGESWFRVADVYVRFMVFSPRYIEDQTILAWDVQKLVLSQDGGESWETLFEYYTKAAGIRIPGPFETQAVPLTPLPGPHQLYFPLVGHGVGDTTLEFWLVRGRYTGSGVECYLYRSYDLGVTWEELFVFEPTHWRYMPLMSAGWR